MGRGRSVFGSGGYDAVAVDGALLRKRNASPRGSHDVAAGFAQGGDGMLLAKRGGMLSPARNLIEPFLTSGLVISRENHQTEQHLRLVEPANDGDRTDEEAPVAPDVNLPSHSRQRTLRRTSVNPDSALATYLRQIRRYPLLSREDEHETAIEFARTGDSRLAARLVTANLRLVVKLARQYRRGHHNLLDLIQEGNTGLIMAVRKFDPNRGVKLSSYAAWWIRAQIFRFIMTNWRLVKVATTQSQRRLFFNVGKERWKLERAGAPAEAKHLAVALHVTEQQIIDMERRLRSERSLDAPVRSERGDQRTVGDLIGSEIEDQPDVQVESSELRVVVRSKLQTFERGLAPRDLALFRRRLLADEPATPTEMAQEFGVSRQRIRQLEQRLRDNVRCFLEKELGDPTQWANA